ncbi:hypothetical protein PROFUN_05139 [Planoprotostelium fungivorum]|uniref:Peptidase C14 caspase domain-containing protein n=1 Tax=Planoprotostelium fungivorum TaxID=1890364 RepID=A0A2P6NRX0_9EUKA|nr:hypothetical protein PROFUN_05139 [Planoprotostelium fungivorum]
MYGSSVPPSFAPPPAIDVQSNGYGGFGNPSGYPPDPYTQQPGMGQNFQPPAPYSQQFAPPTNYPPQGYPPAMDYNQPPPQAYQPPPPSNYNQPPPQAYPPAGNMSAPNYAPPSNYNQPPPSTYNQPPPSNYNQPPPLAYTSAPQSNHGSYATAHRFGDLTTGRRKALLIGINYKGSTAELRGCINDVMRLKQFLLSKGFLDTPQTMVVLTDDQHDRTRSPTRANMIAAMKWLVTGAMPGDSLFFHYSGHGSQVKDTNGDEDDGYDETILPVDFNTAGQIVDDEMHDIMVKTVPAGCRLTAIFDSCHSGTALDLPYIYDTSGTIQAPGSGGARAGGMGGMGGLLNIGMSLLAGQRIDPNQAMQLIHGFKQAKTGSGRQGRTPPVKSAPGDVLMFSGCRDDQTSVDATIGGMATGAMSYAFMEAIRNLPGCSYAQMLNYMRDLMRGKFRQLVQLSSSHPMDMSQPFAI